MWGIPGVAWDFLGTALTLHFGSSMGLPRCVMIWRFITAEGNFAKAVGGSCHCNEVKQSQQSPWPSVTQLTIGHSLLPLAFSSSLPSLHPQDSYFHQGDSEQLTTNTASTLVSHNGPADQGDCTPAIRPTNNSRTGITLVGTINGLCFVIVVCF